MGFVEAVRTCMIEKYATFSGRASRSEYWWFALFSILLQIAVAVILLVLGFPISDNPFSFSTTGDMVTLVMSLALFFPSLAANVRRLHDRNLSGFWVVAAFIPFLNILALIAGLIVFCLRGTPSPNRYGEDPLRARRSAEVFS